MTYIFWQNILSPHQSSFLRNLAKTEDVILVVEEEMMKERMSQGWSVPDFGRVRIVVNPSPSQFDELLDFPDAFHIVSGVWAFPMPSRAFRCAMRKRLPVGIFSEPYNNTGLKGKLRFFKYLWFRMLYGNRIKFLLTTGKLGRNCFESTGFKKAKIFDWGYFTETLEIELSKRNRNKPQLLFVGSINHRKNILMLVDVCKQLNLIDQLTIVGDGLLKPELLDAIAGSRCNYLGNIANNEVYRLISESDLLILPSVFDGWGAVVNEALMCGTPALASDRCGASILLKEERGTVFSIEKNNLQEELDNCIKNLPCSFDKREAIRKWALENISGEAASGYFKEIADYVLNKGGQRPTAPWLK